MQKGAISFENDTREKTEGSPFHQRTFDCMCGSYGTPKAEIQ